MDVGLECASSYREIATLSECREAATALTKTFAGEIKSKEFTLLCILDSNGKVFFNSQDALNAEITREQARICVAGTYLFI